MLHFQVFLCWDHWCSYSVPFVNYCHFDFVYNFHGHSVDLGANSNDPCLFVQHLNLSI